MKRIFWSVFAISFALFAMSAGMVFDNPAHADTPTAVGSIPAQTLTAGNTTSGVVSITASDYFKQIQNPVTYSAVSSDTAAATVSVSGATVTITGVAVGSATITIIETDNIIITNSATQTVSVTVVANQAPTSSGYIAPQTLVPGTGFGVGVSHSFSDPDGDTLTLSASSSNTGVATASMPYGRLSVTAVAAGTATITITATDPGGLTASFTTSVTVVANQAPVLHTLISSQTVSLGSNTDINVSNHFSDPDGDALTFQASSSDTNIMTVSVSGSTVTLTAKGTGTITITVTAADTVSQTASQQFSVTINASQADVLPDITSEERAQIADSLAMDKVIFNELRNASTDAHDWVELRNIGDVDVNLSDWQVLLVTSEATLGVSFPAGAVLPAGELLLLTNTDPNAPGMPLADTGQVSSHYVVDDGLILPQDNFTLLLRSSTGWEDSVGNYFFGYDVPSTAPPLTADSAWYRVRPDALGYQSEAWAESGYQGGIGYDAGVPQAIALGTPGYSQSVVTADVNRDGVVNILDLVLVASQIGESGVTNVDINSDGVVNIQDLVLVANAFEQ